MSARMNAISCALTVRPWMILPASMGLDILNVRLGVQPYVQHPHGFVEKLHFTCVYRLNFEQRFEPPG